MDIVNVGDIATSISETFKFNTKEVVFLNTSDIYDGAILNTKEVSPVGLPGQAKKSIEQNDILFSEIRPINRRFAFVTDKVSNYVVSTKLMVIRVKKSKILPKYLYYFLTSEPILKHLQILAESRSGTFPQITFSEIKNIKIPIPDLDTQTSTIYCLDSIYNLIENKKSENDKLEEIARTLFKSWFVDFNPVRDKVEDRAPYGMDAETGVLFPDSFENSELGKIPKEWKVKLIGDVVKVVGGSTPSTKNPSFWEEGTIHWATPKDLASLSSPVLLDTERCITNLGLQQISSKLLPKGTVLLSSRAPIGYLAISEIPVAINQGFIAMPCDGEFPDHYILYWLKENMGIIEGRANGTTFQEISKGSFRSIPIIVPPDVLLERFNELVDKLHRLIVNNLNQLHILLLIRDTLLPKLLSGEIKLNEVEKLIEAQL